ncbi:MAG: hypothetical protein K0S86_1460 [Geminicoccaceae bacterium]|nr:hypothetical protein [Geminicoccaceae bacterium]
MYPRHADRPCGGAYRTHHSLDDLGRIGGGPVVVERDIPDTRSGPLCRIPDGFVVRVVIVLGGDDLLVRANAEPVIRHRQRRCRIRLMQTSFGWPPTYSAMARFTAANGRPSLSVSAAISTQTGSPSIFLRKFSMASATGRGCDKRRKLARWVHSGLSGKRARTASQSTAPWGSGARDVSWAPGCSRRGL